MRRTNNHAGSGGRDDNRPVCPVIAVALRAALVCALLLAATIGAVAQGAAPTGSPIASRIEQKTAEGLGMAATDYDRAESLWKEAAALGTSGGAAPEITLSLYQAGRRLLNAGYFFPAFRVLIVAEKRAPAKSRAFGQIEDDLGEIAYHQQSLPAARRYFEAALAALDASGAQSEERTRCLLLLAGYHCAVYQHDATDHYVQLFRKQRQAGNGSASQEDPAELLYRAYFRLRSRFPDTPEWLDGKSLLLRLHRLQEASPTPLLPDPMEMVSCHIYGYWLQAPEPEATRYRRKAEECWNRLIQDRDRIYDAITAMNAIYEVAQSSNRFDEIKGYLQSAERVWAQSAPFSFGRAYMLHKLTRIALLQNNPPELREYSRLARPLLERVAPRSGQLAETLLATNLNRMQQAGMLSDKIVDLLQGKQALALDAGELKSITSEIRQALDIAEEIIPGSTAVGCGYGLLAALVFLQNDTDLADTYLRKGSQIVLRERPLDRSNAYFDYGFSLIARRRGNVALAEDFERKAALRLSRTTTSFDSLEKIYVQSIFSRVGMGKEDTVWKAQEEDRAWFLVKRQYEISPSDEGRRALGAQYGSVVARLVEAHLANNDLTAAFRSMEDGRAFGLRLLMAERDIERATTPPALMERYQEANTIAAVRERELDLARQQRKQAYLALQSAEEDRREHGNPRAAADGEKRQAVYEEAVRRVERAQETSDRAKLAAQAIWHEIQRTAPRAFVQNLDAGTGAALLPKGTLYIAFSVGVDSCRVLVLRSKVDAKGESGVFAAGQTLASYPILLPAARLGEMIQQFKQTLTAPDSSPEDVAATAAALFHILFPDQKARTILQAKRLIIAPDGPLWDLPFAILTEDAVSPAYLGLRTPITYTQSLTLYAQSLKEAKEIQTSPGKPSRVNRIASAKDGDVLIVGDPAFSAHGGIRQEIRRGVRGGASPLPYARREAQIVGAIYGAQPLVGPHATKKAVYERLSHARIIHLATHGYFNRDNPMSSGLLLSPGGNGGDDGFLPAREIFLNCHLQADLCVLSACDTGRGQSVNNEGIIGLIRALQYAGARSIVASRWRVADGSTCDLMTELHRQLSRGVDKDEALRRAMVAVEKKTSTRHPYHWGAFFLMGDPGPMSPASPARERPGRSEPVPYRVTRVSGEGTLTLSR